MKTIVVLFIMVFPSSVSAQSVDVPKELTPPKGPTYPEVGNLHDVEVTWPRQAPILKDRKVVPESEVKAPDQGYQTPCQNGDIKRCTGVDMATIESTIRVKKPALPTIAKPVVNIKLVAEVEERRPSSKKKRHHKRR